MTPADRIAALEAFGYTSREAAFLTLAFERFWRQAGQVRASWTDRLLRYFAVRAVYERRTPGPITTETLDRVRDGRAAFSGPRVEALFDRWCREGDASIRAIGEGERQPALNRAITLSTWIAGHGYDLFGSVWHRGERSTPTSDAPQI